MKHYTNAEISVKFQEIFPDADCIEVERNTPEEVCVKISQMYEYVVMNFTHLSKVSEFFETKSINDSRFACGGCETCDYGSSYEIELTIRPD